MILYDRNMSYNYQVAHQQLMNTTKIFAVKTALANWFLYTTLTSAKATKSSRLLMLCWYRLIYML